VAASTGLFAIVAPAATASASSTSVSAFALVETPPVASAVTNHPGAVSVTWTPGAGTARGYAVLATSGTTVKGVAIVPGDATEGTVSGLTNGSNYQMTVVAITDNGVGSPSNAIQGQPTAASPVAGPATAVHGLSALGGQGFATVNWTAPDSDGGSAIAAYSVVAVDRAGNALGAWRNVRPDVRSASLTGLLGGHTYDLYVIPVTALGFGAVAPGVALTISATSIVVPQTPTVPAWATAVPSGDQAVVSWGPASERGQAVTGYNVVVIQNNSMTAWALAGPDQRQVTVPLGENGAASVYVVAQSAGGFGVLGGALSVSHA
jgi:hypothetical protein